MGMEGKLRTETRFLTVVDTYAGYCQICHEPYVVARIAVAGCEHHGTICGQCLRSLADELQRRGKALPVQKIGKTGGNGDALAAMLGDNGNSHAREAWQS
jgi:hypothetical protein